MSGIIADDVSGTAGGGPVDTAANLSKAISDGEGWDIAAQGASAGLETLGVITDPFGSLLSAGIGWVIEHCERLRIPLDQLAGDPRAIKSATQDWHTRSEQLHAAAQDIRNKAKAETNDWEGEAGDAYRRAANVLADCVEGMGSGATGVAGAIQGAGVIVGVIRGMIRDLIADFVSQAITKLAVSMGLSFVTFGASLGAAISWVVGKVGVTVGKIAQKLSDALSRLSGLLGRLGRLGGTVGDIGSQASRVVATGATKMDDVAGAVGRSGVVRSAFNGSTARNVDSGLDTISSSGFNYNRQTGSIDFNHNFTGDAVSAANGLNKEASQVDNTWEEQRNKAEQEVQR